MGKSKQLLLLEPIQRKKRLKTKNNKKKKKDRSKSKYNQFDNLYYWSREIRMRDNYMCVCCGAKRYLSAHHLLYKSKYPALKYSLNNGILLCKKCHIELHTLNDIFPIMN